MGSEITHSNPCAGYHFEMRKAIKWKAKLVIGLNNSYFCPVLFQVSLQLQTLDQIWSPLSPKKMLWLQNGSTQNKERHNGGYSHFLFTIFGLFKAQISNLFILNAVYWLACEHTMHVICFHQAGPTLTFFTQCAWRFNISLLATNRQWLALSLVT